MRYLIIASAFIFCLPLMAQAQVFIQKDQPVGEAKPFQKEKTAPDTPIDETTIEEHLFGETPQEPEAPAPITTIEEYANQYFAKCMEQDHPILKGESHELLCACTSANIPGNMNLDQVREMQKDTAAGLEQRNRMMLFVYAPCIEYPTRALIMDQCVNNPQIKASMKNYFKVCSCLAEGMGKVLQEAAPSAIQQAIERNVKDYDPLRALLDSTFYNEKSQYYLQTCLAKYQSGAAE